MRRRPLMIAVSVGAAASILAWSAFDRGAGAGETLSRLKGLLDSASAPAPRAEVASASSLAAASPLFALTSGSGAVTEPVLRLDGLARNRRFESALLSIDAAAAQWLNVGGSRDGVTLREVQAGAVVVDTATRLRTVRLGEKPPTGAAGVTAKHP